MAINNEDEITGDVARALREAAGLPQNRFWGAIGVNQTSGHRYETGNIKRDRIPRPVRILLYIKYVIGLPIDCNNPNWATEFSNMSGITWVRSDVKASVVIRPKEEV